MTSRLTSRCRHQPSTGKENERGSENERKRGRLHYVHLKRSGRVIRRRREKEERFKSAGSSIDENKPRENHIDVLGDLVSAARVT